MRIERQGAFTTAQSFFMATHIAQDNASIEPGLGIPRVEGKGIVVAAERFRAAS
jgi:hypothetical protein